MSEESIRVVVVDDHPTFRAGLRVLVAETAGLELVGEAEGGESALEIVRATAPDVVLMDIKMPDISGVEATRRLVADDVHPSILILTMLEDDTSLFAAMRAGAKGYILKGSAPEDIVRAIVAVAHGETIFGAAIASKVDHYFKADHKDVAHPLPGLTARERDIIELVAAGQANPAIADQLGLSEKTVRNNVSSIFSKLRVADRAQLIVRAREAGLGQAAR